MLSGGGSYRDHRRLMKANATMIIRTPLTKRSGQWNAHPTARSAPQMKHQYASLLPRLHAGPPESMVKSFAARSFLVSRLGEPLSRERKGMPHHTNRRLSC